MGKKIITMLSLLMTLCLFAGCAADGDFRAITFDHVADEVKSLNIAVRDRSVSITPSTDGMVHIDAFASTKEGYDISLSDDGTLTMESVYNKDWTDFFGGKPTEAYRTITVALPSGVLEDLSVSTTNEDVKVSDIAVTGSASLSSNGGNVIVDDIDVGKALTLTVKNGDISGNVVGGYDDFAIDVTIKKGDSNQSGKTGGEKTLTLDANNGDINLTIGGN